MRLHCILLICTTLLGAVNCFQLNAGWTRSQNLFGRNLLQGGAQLPLPTVRKPPSSLPTPLSATAAETPSEPWTKPRLHNNPLVRSATLLIALALTGLSAPFGKLSSTFMASVHLLSFGAWFGTVFYTTFIAGITMFKNLPRQTFGKLQSKLFPKYFTLCSISIVLQLITVSRLPGIVAASTRALGVSLAMTLLNQFILEPKSTKVMFARYEFDNSDDPSALESAEYKKLRASFGKLHGMSSLTNLVAFIGAVCHGVLLASALVKGA